MSYILFEYTPESPNTPSEWNNFITHCGATIEGWEEMTSRQADKATADKLKDYNAWVSDDVMDDHGIWPTHWSLHFETEKDATAFVLRWA